MKMFDTTFADPFEYVDWLVRARRIIFDFDLAESARVTNSYNLISANVEKLLPELSGEKTHIFCREVKWNQTWAAHDQQCFHLLETTQVIDPHGMLDRAATEGMIFCTYHVGSYRLINSILHARDIDFSLVADNDFVTEQGPHVQALAEQLQREYLGRDPRPFEVIDAESATGALRALRALRQEKSLLLYIDGNTGVRSASDDESRYIQVDFLSRRLRARKGIAFLSFMGKRPIVPVVCVRTGWLAREIHVLSPIAPAEREGRESYCAAATQKLYTVLESYLRRVPEQWEGWFYVHKFLDTRGWAEEEGQCTGLFDPMGIYRFNRERFSLLHFGDQIFLFNRKSFAVSTITPELDEILRAFGEPKAYHELSFERFDVALNVLNELHDHAVIIPSGALDTPV